LASVIQLTNTQSWAQSFVRNRPLGVVAGYGGASTDPGFTNGSMVLQTILGPPFAWRWNRTISTFNLVAGQQDYPEALATFGWIEHAEVQDIEQTPNKWYPLEPVLSLGLETSQGRPGHISAEKDNNAGQITFRFSVVPDQPYPVSLTTQNKAILFTALTQTWAPIPDEYSYIYNWGYLALALFYADDPRWQMANQKFVAHLLGAAQGLSQTQISIFLNNWAAISGTPMMDADRLQQGVQALGT
jgi:hypothetical protein